MDDPPDEARGTGNAALVRHTARTAPKRLRNVCQVMKLPWLQLLAAIRSSYWFLPSVMVLFATMLGAVMVWLDSGPAAGLLDGIAWYQMSKPDGAREVLSTIAGSMITVAGVVFSITIVAISFAASQYGPRILTNFMSDRGNQVTLGTFIATFTYCLVVLRTIHEGETDFVPQLAVFVALLLAFCSIAVLIYFVHHVPASIHANSVAARVGRELIHLIKRQFPTCLGEPPEETTRDESELERLAQQRFSSASNVAPVAADSDGYIQTIDSQALMKATSECGLILCLDRSPGQFVYHGGALALVSPADRLTHEAAHRLRDCFTVGTMRTPIQDELFLVDELVEIAARALSPGVNDPYTAMTCIDWLSAAFAELARRRPPSRFRLDDSGELRVITAEVSFEQQVRHGFGRMRSYLAGDVNAAAQALGTYARLAQDCRSGDQVEVLASEADALLRLADHKLEPAEASELRNQARDPRERIDEALRRCGGARGAA